MIVYGKHSILSLLNKRSDLIKKLYLAHGFSLPASYPGVVKEYCDNHTLEKVSGDRHHQGAVALLTEFPYQALEDTIKSAETLCLLDHIEDPGNLGAIIRNAVSYGVDAIVIQSKRSCDITGAVIKASAGTAFDLAIIKVANLNDAIKKIKAAGFWVYGFEAGDQHLLGTITFDQKAAIVLGSEGAGLHTLTRNNCDFIVSIEMAVKDLSLNVSAASAIIFYARHSQRQKPVNFA